MYRVTSYTYKTWLVQCTLLYTTVHKRHFLQSIRTTRQCLSGRELYDKIYVFCFLHSGSWNDVAIVLTLILPGGASEAHFTFFHGKSPHFPVYFNQRIQNKPHLKTWDNILKSLHYNFAFSKIWKIVSKRASYLINGLLRPPPPGRIGFKK